MLNPPQPLTQEPQPARTWRVGTLVYTRSQLFGVFFWLLWGDFCLHLMDNGVMPTLVPLQLDSYGASKTLINFITGTFINLMFFLAVPIVSTASDRHRSAHGRRIPFLAIPTPLLALCLILLGFSYHIARLLQIHVPLLSGYQPMSIALALACVFYVCVKFFDMFPQSVYYYLWADVIPAETMGVFGCLFRVCYAGGSLVFNWYLIGMAKQHPERIYLASALAYLFAFTLLCLFVREGGYPPPEAPQRANLRRGRWEGLGSVAKTYMRECFTSSFWWKFFLMSAAFQAGYQPFNGNLVLYAKEIFGTSPEGLKRYGHILALRDVIWIVIYLGLAPLMSRLHPLKAALAASALMTIAALASFFTIHDPFTFGLMTILTFVSVAFYLGGTAALPPRMLPRERYGQFASAGAMVFRLSVAAAALGMGTLLDHTATARYIFLWLGVFNGIGTILTLLVYRDFQRLGGEAGYTPPSSTAPR